MKYRFYSRISQKLILLIIASLPLYLMAAGPGGLMPKPLSKPVVPTTPPKSIPIPIPTPIPGSGVKPVPTVLPTKPIPNHDPVFEGKKRPETEYEVTKELLKNDPIIQKLLDKEKKIDIQSEAFQGILIEHQAYSDSLGLRHVANHETSGKFEQALAQRLVGKDNVKELKKEDIEDLQALTCASKCGHSKFNLSCRRITRFLGESLAAAGILGIPVGALFYKFMTTEPSKNGKSIELTNDGKKVIIDKLDEEIPEEKVTSTKESK